MSRGFAERVGGVLVAPRAHFRAVLDEPLGRGALDLLSLLLLRLACGELPVLLRAVAAAGRAASGGQLGLAAVGLFSTVLHVTSAALTDVVAVLIGAMALSLLGGGGRSRPGSGRGLDLASYAWIPCVVVQLAATLSCAALAMPPTDTVLAIVAAVGVGWSVLAWAVALGAMRRESSAESPPGLLQPHPRVAGALLLCGFAALAALNVYWLVAGRSEPIHAPSAKSDSSLSLPDGDLPLAEGGRLSFAAQHGHPLVLIFFATWCGPCLEELPEVSRAFAQLAQRGVPLYAISVDGPTLDEARAQVSEFRAHHPNPLPVAFDQGVLSARFGVETIPRTLVFDKSGRLQRTLDGPEDAATIVAAVASLDPN